MSNKKINSKMLKDLIKEVLSESKRMPTKDELEALIASARIKKGRKANAIRLAIQNDIKNEQFSLTTGEQLSIAQYVKGDGDLADKLKTILKSGGNDKPPSHTMSASSTAASLSNKSSAQDFNTTLSGITSSLTKTTAAQETKKFDEIMVDYKALHKNQATKQNSLQSDFDKKKTQVTKSVGNYGTTVTVNKHQVKVPAKSDMKAPSPAFKFGAANIPMQLKKAILRSFQAFLNPNTALTDLASISESLLMEDTTALDWEDFAAILSDKSSPLFRPAVQAIKQVSNTDAGQPYAKALTSMLNQNVDTATSASVAPAGIPTMDVSDMFGADRKTVPGYVVAAFDSMGLGQASTVKERIELINKYSANLMKAAPDVSEISLGEAMGSIAVLNGLGRIVQRMDDKAAGWAFESFLAQLVNGTTEGTAMGAADFEFGLAPDEVFPAKTKGSAKLISGTSTSQAVSTMSALLPGKKKYVKKTFEAITALGNNSSLGKDDINWGNSRVVYIIGKKLDSSKKGIANPKKVTSVAIYMVEIRRKSGSGEVLAGELTTNNSDITADVGKTGKVEIKLGKAKPIGTITLAKDLAQIDKFGQAALAKIDQEIPKLLKEMEIFSSSTKEYLIGGDASDVDKAVSGYASMFNLVNSVFGSTGAAAQQSGVYAGVQTTSTGVTAQTSTALEEGKITSNFLKKLIQETLKK